MFDNSTDMSPLEVHASYRIGGQIAARLRRDDPKPGFCFPHAVKAQASVYGRSAAANLALRLAGITSDRDAYQRALRYVDDCVKLIRN